MCPPQKKVATAVEDNKSHANKHHVKSRKLRKTATKRTGRTNTI